MFADEATHGQSPKKQSNKLQELLPKMNPFWIRVPFGKPDALLAALSPLFGWLLTPPATVVGIVYMLAAVVSLLANWNSFAAASASVFSPDNWLWLLLAWLVLKVVHELAHGITCRRYGGNVRETGVIFAFFAPLAYVDVTSSWAFSSRWRRIHTAAAGMYVELLLASTAVFLWPHVRSEMTAHLLYNVIVMASFSTLIFNANPLMKFDGYYILSDLLQIPNLQQRSSEATQQLFQGILFGVNGSTPRVTGSQLTVLRTYGIAAFCWRLFICASMTIAASVLFHGAGVALSVAGVLAWFAVPLWKTAEQWVRLTRVSPGRSIRAGCVGVAGFVLVAACFVVPVPFSITAPGVVALNDGCVIRGKVDGFIDTIHVKEGQEVSAGDLLITLRNTDVTTEYQDLKLQVCQETIRRQTAMRDHDAGLVAIAEGNLASLQSRLSDAKQRLDDLSVVATTSGRIQTRGLDQRLNAYVNEGDELLIVDNLEARELRVLIAQEDFNIASQHVDATAAVRLGTRPLIHGSLAQVVPRASHRIPEESLSATNGGPLAVRALEDESEDLRLTEPRFEAIVQLPFEHRNLPIGERGYASICRSDESIGLFCYRAAKEWLEEQLIAAN